MAEHAEQHETIQENHGDELGFERIVFFSDAVMAIAITLMALEIRLPELEPEFAVDKVGAAFEALIPHIFVYVLSFLVIGLYWVIHHRLFRVIKRFDVRLIWFNLIFLMTVAFVPVATNAFGTYPNLGATTAFYAFSVALVGISEFVLWTYAVRRDYTNLSNRHHGQLYFSLRMLVPPLVFLFSIPLAGMDAHWAQNSWLMMIPLIYLLRFVFPQAHAERKTYDAGER